MKVLISSLDDTDFTDEIEVRDISYSKSDGKFSMPIIRGDDWFQRLTSDLPFIPSIVRTDNNIMFVVFDNTEQCKEFKRWLEVAEKAVEEGIRTMRG